MESHSHLSSVFSELKSTEVTCTEIICIHNLQPCANGKYCNQESSYVYKVQFFRFALIKFPHLKLFAAAACVVSSEFCFLSNYHSVSCLDYSVNQQSQQLLMNAHFCWVMKHARICFLLGSWWPPSKVVVIIPHMLVVTVVTVDVPLSEYQG